MRILHLSTKKIALLTALISVAVLVSALVWRDLNLSFFIRLLFDDAKEFAATGVITSTFMPIGYSWLLGAFMVLGGAGAIPACQALIYAGVLFAVLWFLKERGLSGWWLAVGILAVAVHPLLVLNVWRVHDGNITALFLLGFAAAGIWFLHSKNKWGAVLLGVVTGILSTVRQNALALFLPAFFVLWENKGKRFTRIAAFAAVAFVLMAGITMAVKRTPSFLGEQGAYNFFSGTNEYATEYFLKEYSGENSLEPALVARGFSSVGTFEERLSFPSDTYWRLTFEFVKNHPLEYVKLTGLKLITFLRPGYHMVQDFAWNSAEGLKRLSKILLSLPFFIWVFFAWKTRKHFFDKDNLFVFAVVVLYTLPFILANADPRYRFPLDILLIADSFCRAHELFVPRAERSSENPA